MGVGWRDVAAIYPGGSFALSAGRRFHTVDIGDNKGTVHGFAIADVDGDVDIAAARSEAPNVIYFGCREPK